MSEWISVVDRLPDAFVAVIWSRSGQTMEENIFWDGAEWLYIAGMEPVAKHAQPTHWMSLPSPPDSQ